MFLVKLKGAKIALRMPIAASSALRGCTLTMGLAGARPATPPVLHVLVLLREIVELAPLINTFRSTTMRALMEM